MARADTKRKLIDPKPSKGTVKPGTKGGRPSWAPARATLRRDGVTGTETETAAWERVRNWVRLASAYGMQQEVMCELLNPPCNRDTLRRHFRKELTHGKEEMLSAVAGALFNSALRGDGANMRFIMETQAGWSRKVDLTGTQEIIVRNIMGDEDR